MSKTESSKNDGPHALVSISGATSGTHSKPFDTRNYTKHSYQVNCSNIGASTDLAFYIYARNDSNNPPKWQKIAAYRITNSINNNGILYFDCWNFVLAKCAVVGTFDGASISVVEKHNA